MPAHLFNQETDLMDQGSREMGCSRAKRKFLWSSSATEERRQVTRVVGAVNFDSAEILQNGIDDLQTYFRILW